MKKVNFCVLMLCLLCFSGKAQITEKVNDMMREMEAKQLTLYFHNAINGEPVVAAILSSDKLGNFSTNEAGQIFLDIPEDGIYSLKFEKEKYISATFQIEVQAGTLFFNRFSVSPLLINGKMRIVLDWEDSPRDLDLHLVKENAYHVSYRKMKRAQDGGAWLDIDDRNGNGPETITIHEIDPTAVYKIWVHDYSNRTKSRSRKLSKSKAHIRIYAQDSGLLRQFIVPQGQQGTFWQVVEIRNGEIVTIPATLSNNFPQ